MRFEKTASALPEPSVLLPVVCPECGLASESEFPIVVVMIGLADWHQMAFYAGCHPTPWNASPLELQKTRTFLGEPWIKAHWGIRADPYAPVISDEEVDATEFH